MQGAPDIEYSRSSIAFTWVGFDEMDEVSGDGSVELLHDGSIEIEFAYHNGDEAGLKAKRDTSSTACWAIGMVDQARRRLLALDGHGQGCDGQFRPHVVTHRPADDFAGEEIEHDG
jgi:hypothetical protein